LINKIMIKGQSTKFKEKCILEYDIKPGVINNERENLSY